MPFVSTDVGIGPWSIEVGAFGLVLLAALLGLVIYDLRKDD